jgi:hypothetical protein
VPAPISDIGPVGPVRACDELLATGVLLPPLLVLAVGLLLPPLLVLAGLLAVGAGELSVWLVTRGV